MPDLDFIAEQFQSSFHLSPEHWNQTEGCIFFDSVPVFYTVQDDVFILECDNVSVEVPRYS